MKKQLRVDFRSAMGIVAKNPPLMSPAFEFGESSLEFSDFSALLRLAQMCFELAGSLWHSFFNADWWMKPLLLPFTVVYGALALTLGLVLFPCCLLDVPGYVAYRMEKAMMATASDLSEDTEGFFATLFRPLAVIALCLMVVVIYFVPKNPGLGK